MFPGLKHAGIIKVLLESAVPVKEGGVWRSVCAACNKKFGWHETEKDAAAHRLCWNCTQDYLDSIEDFYK